MDTLFWILTLLPILVPASRRASGRGYTARRSRRPASHARNARSWCRSRSPPRHRCSWIRARNSLHPDDLALELQSDARLLRDRLADVIDHLEHVGGGRGPLVDDVVGMERGDLRAADREALETT